MLPKGDLPIPTFDDAAGWVIPFLTAVRNGSSSNFHYWPEMDTGGLIKL